MSSRFGFRPTLWPTLFTVPAVIFMLGLSVWQLERRTWKMEVIETRQARATEPVVAPPVPLDMKTFEYRRLKVRGRFLHDKEMYLGARSRRGNPGYHVVTPLIQADGRAILVDRGWIPLKRKDPKTRPAGRVEGEREVIGHVRKSGRTGWALPDNQPDKNFWLFVDAPAMAKYAGVTLAKPYYLQLAGEAPPGGWPRPAPIKIDLPNNHLQYAITWFLLAIGLSAVYILYHRRRRTS